VSREPIAPCLPRRFPTPCEFFSKLLAPQIGGDGRPSVAFCGSVHSSDRSANKFMGAFGFCSCDSVPTASGLLFQGGLWFRAACGPSGQLRTGQSMSALPADFRHQLVPLLRARHRPRCRDSGPCSRSSCARARAARPAGCRCAGRSASPWSVSTPGFLPDARM
jgi:hypothetical protein